MNYINTPDIICQFHKTTPSGNRFLFDYVQTLNQMSGASFVMRFIVSGRADIAKKQHTPTTVFFHLTGWQPYCAPPVPCKKSTRVIFLLYLYFIHLKLLITRGRMLSGYLLLICHTCTLLCPKAQEEMAVRSYMLRLT